jgi:GNAT superfamily N-acetyltransferase
MKIVEYSKADPLQVLYLTLLAQDDPLTPERAAHIRHTDPRPFPWLGLCAVEDETVIGYAGLFRLPLVTPAGREDVGGVGAVSIHPQYAGRGAASRLLDEAHARMRSAGLRYSTAATARYQGIYRLFRQHGYEDMNAWGTALARWETAHQPTRLRAEPAGSRGYELTEQVFATVAGSYLGFAWRQPPFAPLRDKAKLEEIYILWENSQPVGYALAYVDQSILNVSSMLLKQEVNPAEAVAAIASRVRTAHIQVKVSRPVEINSLRQSGYRVAHPDWSAFMIKPLLPGGTANDARSLFGIGTDQFLISWLDTT